MPALDLSLGQQSSLLGKSSNTNVTLKNAFILKTNEASCFPFGKHPDIFEIGCGAQCLNRLRTLMRSTHPQQYHLRYQLPSSSHLQFESLKPQSNHEFASLQLHFWDHPA